MNRDEEDPVRYVVDSRHVRIAAVLVVLGALLLSIATIAFTNGRPLVWGFCFLAGLCSASLGLFFRPGEHTRRGRSFLFGTYLASGVGALVLLVYAGVRNLLH